MFFNFQFSIFNLRIMLNKIIHFSLHNRILVLVASVLLLVGGFYTAYHTEVDVFPDLTAPTVVVMTEANGMAAEEVEQLVTFPLTVVSIGKVTNCSTSSAAMPLASVITTTVGAVKSGNTSTSV